jgi:hypothetical protein
MLGRPSRCSAGTATGEDGFLLSVEGDDGDLPLCSRPPLLPPALSVMARATAAAAGSAPELHLMSGLISAL